MNYKIRYLFLLIAGLFLFPKSDLLGQKSQPIKADTLDSSVLNGLKFRCVGPALTSGRVVDIAVNPKKPGEYYVAAAAGGVWKTRNWGTTYEPIFESQGSYSIGCIALDPGNSQIIWVGTGENNNQRSVGYGDGVYRSPDGGKTWKNMGLKTSEHIGNILVHPTNSDIVFVAAYGPLWSSGGERGIYKSTDAGKTWTRILHVSDHTGFNEIHMDPTNPDILYATAHQRRRHEFTYISGGPESAIYKSTNGGTTWDKLTSGLPSGEVGRISLSIPPSNPSMIYAIIEADPDSKGIYVSLNKGETWEKRNSYSTAGNYYQEIFSDPKNADKIFIMDTYAQVSEDGGKTVKSLGEKSKHVDNHCIWIDPNNTSHFLVGCDGGIYESWDAAQTWDYKSNLPITQFYRVSTDNDTPFYNIFGGTQDNFSLGGPSKTMSANGISNADWFITNGGDGFESQVDPQNPDIVYAQSQYGGLVRYDRKSGQIYEIRPIELAGDSAWRWNWDAPLQISRFDNKTLYFCANKVFKSEDQGNSWKTISGNLSRGIDRNSLKVMDKFWSAEAIARNQSTSVYGNITAFAESPLNSDMLLAGTDDGLIHITKNGGKDWTKLSSFSGVPDQTLVLQIQASRHTSQTIYAVFNNHRNGDFKPYLVRSTDGGLTWNSINGNLPARGSTYCIYEDPIDAKILFAGTEFGIFITLNGGDTWTQIKAGLPTICVKDITIQEREQDLVIATFGRGFYILEDISVFRQLKKENLEKEAFIFPVKESKIFIQKQPLGLEGNGFQGESYFNTPNPVPGAVFTWHLKDTYKTLKDLRKEKEDTLAKANKPIPYPNVEEFRAEENEEATYLLFEIKNSSNDVVRKIKTSPSKGINRLTWDFRYTSAWPVQAGRAEKDEAGPLAAPGVYSVSLYKVVNGQNVTQISGPVNFTISPHISGTFEYLDKNALEAYNLKLTTLRSNVFTTEEKYRELISKVKLQKEAILVSGKTSLSDLSTIKSIENTFVEIELALYGDKVRASRDMETLPGITGRVESVVYSMYNTTSGPSGTFLASIEYAEKELEKVQDKLKAINKKVAEIDDHLQRAGAPYTPGR